MTVLSRGARSRRGGRRPGWQLLTALLVLAIGASSALVFTSRAELLRLAVILALWAAVVAAFVSVIYRRQSDADAAKARDLKLVYDLQLEREISARREYELTVESQLRRELASELRAEAADEVAALRAELAALRTNLEILFETELTHRPAIEPERSTVRAYSDWARDTEGTNAGRGAAPRFAAQVDVDTGEDRIIDVPEEPLGRRHPDEEPLGRRHPDEEPLGRRHPDEPQPPPQPLAERVGRHGTRAERVLSSDDGEWNPVPAEGQWPPPGAPAGNPRSANNGVSGEHAPSAESTSAPVVAQPAAGRHANPAPPSSRQHGEGQSVAELLARLQTTPSGGGRRRRRGD